MRRTRLACAVMALAGVVGLATASLAADSPEASPQATATEPSPPEPTHAPSLYKANEEPIEPEVAKGGRWMTREEYMLGVLVLGFGLAFLLLQFLTVRNRELTAEAGLRFGLLTLIVVGTIFLVVAGFSDQQIAPAVGLFGTIAGYVLGKGERRSPVPGEKES